MLTGAELPFPMTRCGCSHCFVVIVVVIVVVIFVVVFFISTFVKLIANYRLCVVGYAFTASLWPLLLTWFNFNPSMDK